MNTWADEGNCEENSDFSFHELMNRYEVRIPLIQRDYAQGRLQEYSVRESFVGAIVHALENNTPLPLDFVYGTKDDKERWFKPLDGQQRLTTLALVYWYFGLIPRDRDVVWRFTYESRRMAMRFVSELFKLSYDASEIPTKWIEKQPGIAPAWLKDPTVSGMLRMLDHLHHKTSNLRKKLTDLRKKLTVDDLSRVRFWCHFCNCGVSEDETYLKINARGEPLSEWENIKAILDERATGIIKAKSSFDHSIVEAAESWRKSINCEWETLVEACLPERKSGDPLPYFIAMAVDLVNTAFRNIVDLAAVISLSDQTVSSWVADERRKNEGVVESSLGVLVLGSRRGAESIRTEKDLLGFMVEAFHEHRAEYEDYRDSRILPDRVFPVLVELFNGLECWDEVSASWSSDRACSRLWHKLSDNRGKDPESVCAANSAKKDFLFAGVRMAGDSLTNEEDRKSFLKWVESYGDLYSRNLMTYSNGIRYALLIRADRDIFGTSRALNILDYLDVKNWSVSFGMICSKLQQAQKEGLSVLDCEDFLGLISSGGMIKKVIGDELFKVELYNNRKREFLGIECRRGAFKGMIRFAFDPKERDYTTSREQSFVDRFFPLSGDGEAKASEGFLALLDHISNKVDQIWLPRVFGSPAELWEDWRWFLYEDVIYDAYKRLMDSEEANPPSWVSHYKTLIGQRKHNYSRVERHWCKWGSPPRMFVYDGTTYISKSAICVEYTREQVDALRELAGCDSYFVNFDNVGADEVQWEKICEIMAK